MNLFFKLLLYYFFLMFVFFCVIKWNICQRIIGSVLVETVVSLNFLQPVHTLLF